MKRYGVKIEVQTSTVPSDRTGLILEQLRYAQVVSLAEYMDGKTEITYWSPLPRGSNHEYWQKSNVRRAQSFGLKAEPVTQNA